MATLERINYQPMVRSETGKWTPSPYQSEIQNLPLIFWQSNQPWKAANKFAYHKISSPTGSNIKTIDSLMKHLVAYANWLEEHRIDWRHFPVTRKDRCLFRFRGYLIEQREQGVITPSTASARMSAVLQFYRFAQAHNIIERYLWADKLTNVQFYNAHGFSRTMSVTQSELSIPNRIRNGLKLEGGLDPVSRDARNQLFRFLQLNNMTELHLMHLIGFTTGARSETIRTLKVSSLEYTLPDPREPRIHKLPVGPGTTIKTKYDVTGNLLITEDLIALLQSYSCSVERIIRQAKAKEEHKSYLFLTRTGRPYSESTFTKLMSELRKKLRSSGIKQLDDFKFHQSRATFGTMLMKIALETRGSNANAVAFVRDAMLHKYESTTWRYVKFIEETPLMERYAEEFFSLFTGVNNEK